MCQLTNAFCWMRRCRHSASSIETTTNSKFFYRLSRKVNSCNTTTVMQSCYLRLLAKSCICWSEMMDSSWVDALSFQSRVLSSIGVGSLTNHLIATTTIPYARDRKTCSDSHLPNLIELARRRSQEYCLRNFGAFTQRKPV